MTVHPGRIQKLTTHEYVGGSVLYWMNRDIRAEDNWALLYAQELALAQKVPLLVLYNLAPGFLGGGLRQHLFKLQALESVSIELEKKKIPFFIVSGPDTQKEVVAFILERKIGAVVTDFSPLRIQRGWVNYVQTHVQVPLYCVDAHNIVPVWKASTKQEFGAYTLRPKLYKLLPEYLEPYPALRKHPHVYDSKIPHISWKLLREDASVDALVTPVDWILANHAHAKRALQKFIGNKLGKYADGRNDPLQDVQSNLSPYLHYGILSSQRVALEVIDSLGHPIEKILSNHQNKAKVEANKEPALIDHAGAFLEELIVRKELSDNFCSYNEHYDTPKGFPEWAKKSHAAHAGDEREHHYTKKQFEHAMTHDELWNAAQREMVHKGKMHGYMRMYWAKKILEWTRSPEEAMKIAIYLNDKYELDGRDPNGYAGIAWSIGGVHDRAWFVRPVFGQIRYMNANGCRTKFDVDSYIQRWKT